MIKKSIVLAPFIYLILDILNSTFGYMVPNELSVLNILDITLNLIPLTLFVVIDAYRRKQTTFTDMVAQSSFYIFILSVFYLTLFPISTSTFFIRIQESNLLGVNIVPFRIFSHYYIFDTQIIGNLIMLFPLGIYLHLLYKQVNSVKRAICVIFFTSVFIELSQLTFSSRSTDIDDVILNTIGGCIGFIFYKHTFAKYYYKKMIKSKPKVSI